MVLVTFRYERYSCSCSKVFCWTAYKISTMYLGYEENRPLNTVKQHDHSLRQVTSVSFVVIKQAAGNFCGYNWDSTVDTYILTILRISLLSVIYLQVLVHASNITFAKSTEQWSHSMKSVVTHHQQILKEHSQNKSLFWYILYVWNCTFPLLLLTCKHDLSLQTNQQNGN